jgi:hypothetical protein
MDSGGGGLPAGFWVLYFIVIIFVLATLWKIFTKAGKPGWAAIVPIYNIIVLLEIVNKPIWWFLLFFIPVVGIIFSFIVYIRLAKAFGHSAGFGVGLVLLSIIFLPILAFENSQYQPELMDR